MFVGTNLHVIPIGQYSKNISDISISSKVLKPNGQEISYLFNVYHKGVILYIFRNLQFSQIFFIYDNYVGLWQRNGHSLTFDYKYSYIFHTSYTTEHTLVRRDNFFVVLLKDKKDNALKALCIYYDLKNDLYKYQLLELTNLTSHVKSIGNITVIGRFFSKDDSHDCVGLMISTNTNQVIVILHQKDTDRFLARHIMDYDRTSNLFEHKRSKFIYDLTRKMVSRAGLRFEFLHSGSSIIPNKRVLLKLGGSHVVINVKAENKISVFCNNMAVVNDNVGEAIAPDTYHNLDPSIQDYYFECVKPTLVYS